MQLKLSTLTEYVISFKVSLAKGAIEGFTTEIILSIFSRRTVPKNRPSLLHVTFTNVDLYRNCKNFDKNFAKNNNCRERLHESFKLCKYDNC